MKTRISISIAICLIALITSVFFLVWTWDLLVERSQDEFIRQASVISEGFDSIAISQFSRGDGKNDDPEYLRIVDQLLLIDSIYPDIENAILIKQDGEDQVYVFVDPGDSELEEEVYSGASVELLDVFITGNPSITGPIIDENGHWFQVYSPIIDRFSGKKTAVLGLVIDASDWNQSIQLDFNLPLWSVIILNLSIWGLVVFLVYRQKAQEQPRMEVLVRYYMMVFSGLIGACLTILAVWYVSFYEMDSRNEIFQQLSSAKANNLAIQLKDIDRFSLQGLEEFFRGSDFVASDEFSQYSQALIQNELVSAWAWIPKVEENDRINFEKNVEGNILSNDGIWEFDSAGKPQTAEKKDAYFPVEYIMPETATNLGLVGFDLASKSNLRSEFEKAIESGLSGGSIPLNTLFGASGDFIIVFRPVNNSIDHYQTTGLVAAFIQIDELIHVAKNSLFRSESRIYFDFFQVAPEGEKILLLSNSPGDEQKKRVQSNLQFQPKIELTRIQPLFLYGNTYAISTHPSPYFAELYPAHSGFILALAGGLLTIALMFLVYDTSGRNILLSKLVSQRTEELSESEERLRLASESVKLGIYDINTRTWDVIVNDIYAEMLGYDPDEFHETYEGWQKRLHPKDQQKVRKLFDDFSKGKASEYRAEFRLKNARADWVWIFTTAMVVERDENDQPLRILGSHLDITARKKATAKILQLLDQSNRRLKQMETLREIDKAITSNFGLKRIMSQILEEVKQQLNVDVVLIFLFDEEEKVFRYTNGLGLNAVELGNLMLDPHISMAGKAVDYGRPIHTQAIEDLADPSILLLMEEEGIKDCFAFPLVTKQKTKGVLEMWHRSVKIPNSGWMKFAETLAGQIAIAIEYSQLISGLQDANENLRRAYDETIFGWSLALDLKDKETEGHTQRVTQMTVDLAKRIGIQGEALDHIRRGALLHDIGKMGIPDSILLKPGRLTDEEWSVMKKHPLYAFEMLKTVEYLRPALDIPYLHHEKWDGTGYPLGVKGSEIPLPARIFAIVDVYDALISDRPYRPAWTVEKVLDYIEENSGIHFDPAIVPVFIAMIRESLGKNPTPEKES
jgi:PAS domain S-box-containing protein